MGFLACLQAFISATANTHGLGDHIAALTQQWPGWTHRYLFLREGRANGTRSHPLTFAESFIPALFLVVALFFSKTGERKIINFSRMDLFFGGILVLAGIYFSQTRGVWLGCMAGFSFLFFLKESRTLRIWGIVLLALVLLVGVMAPTFRGRFLSIFSSRQGSGSDQGSKWMRYQLWKSSLAAIRNNPVLGVGMKGAKFDMVDPNGNRGLWSESHNIYLQSAVDMGWPGFSLLILMLGVLGVRIFFISPPWRWAFVGTLVAFLLAGLTESWMGDRTIAMIFWSFMGLGEYFSVQSGGDSGPQEDV